LEKRFDSQLIYRYELIITKKNNITYGGTSLFFRDDVGLNHYSSKLMITNFII